MRNYRLKREVIQVNLVDYNICSLFDRQETDDDDDEARAMGISSATWSLFGVIWPASLVLAAEVSLINRDKRRILEIGCGIGMASIVLHKLGADITASDYHPRAQEFLDRNILENGLTPIKYQSVDFEKENPLLGKFDLIIASDLLYQPQHAENLSRLISIHSSDDVEVIVIDPGRENRAKFTRNMIELGFSHEFVNFNRQVGEGIHCKGRIMNYRRKGNPAGTTLSIFPTKNSI
jgi:predicted nicotinamide N-methyase